MADRGDKILLLFGKGDLAQTRPVQGDEAPTRTIASTSVTQLNPNHTFQAMNAGHAVQNVTIMLISEPPIQWPSPRS